MTTHLASIADADLSTVSGAGWKKNVLKYAGAAIGGGAGTYLGSVAGTYIAGPAGTLIGGGAGGSLGAALGYDGGAKLGDYIEGKEVKTTWVNPT